MAVRNEAQLKRAEEALESIKLEEQGKSGHRVITLADVLQRYGGAQCDFAWEYSEDKRFICYEVNGVRRCSEVFEDALSGERSVFIVLPIEYIHHDALINPRPVNLNLIKVLIAGSLLVALLALLVDWLGRFVEHVARPKGL